MGIHPPFIRKKMDEGMKLSAVEERYMLTTGHPDTARPSRRRWSGWREAPDSKIDLSDD